MLTIICFHRRDERCCVVFGNAQKNRQEVLAAFRRRKKSWSKTAQRKEERLVFRES
jgi:hypothetical protein